MGYLLQDAALNFKPNVVNDTLKHVVITARSINSLNIISPTNEVTCELNIYTKDIKKDTRGLYRSNEKVPKLYELNTEPTSNVILDHYWVGPSLEYFVGLSAGDED